MGKNSNLERIASSEFWWHFLCPPPPLFLLIRRLMTFLFLNLWCILLFFLFKLLWSSFYSWYATFYDEVSWYFRVLHGPFQTVDLFSSVLRKFLLLYLLEFPLHYFLLIFSFSGISIIQMTNSSKYTLIFLSLLSISIKKEKNLTGNFLT